MKTFPLIRTKWTNEHYMAAIFAVLTLYQLPAWLADISSAWAFLAVLAAALAADFAANMIRYRKLVCSVSAAVTAAILNIPADGAPIWVRLLGVVLALLVGKHIWGGTGKNVFNPALTGLLFISLFFKVGFPLFTEGIPLLPAFILSLPFARFRPFAAAGLMAGMAAALFSAGGLSVSSVFSYGIIFWGCLVITDPVTVTGRPVYGAVAGFLSGFLPLFFHGDLIIFILGILLVNAVTFFVDARVHNKPGRRYKPLRINKTAVFTQSAQFADLTEAKAGDAEASGKIYEGQKEEPAEDLSEKPPEKRELSKQLILERIKSCDVFGFGGAAFPTWRKINAVLQSDSGERHFIINAVECDPGLLHDKWLLKRFPEEICKGIDLICRTADFASVTLAVKNTGGLRFPWNIKIHKVRDYFPAGAENLLIAEVLGNRLAGPGQIIRRGREKIVKRGVIPAEAGILVLNVQTVLSVYEAVRGGKAADTRLLTAADLRKGDARVVRVRLGTRIRDAMDVLYPGSSCIFAGGGIMQAHIASEDDIIDKKVNFIATGDIPNYKESPLCSKCGVCALHCPAGLEAGRIADIMDARDEEGDGSGALPGGSVIALRQLGARDCIGCGACSYSCLAGRDLASRVKEAKSILSVE